MISQKDSDFGDNSLIGTTPILIFVIPFIANFQFKQCRRYYQEIDTNIIARMQKILPGRSNKYNNVSPSPAILECHNFSRKPATRGSNASASNHQGFKGEILEGVVHKVLKHAVFMRCRPIENVFLSNFKMPDYVNVPGENPAS